jgi:hypothetical protein
MYKYKCIYLYTSIHLQSLLSEVFYFNFRWKQKGDTTILTTSTNTWRFDIWEVQ